MAILLTVKQVAERYGCQPGKVGAWIESGELIAINVAVSANGKYGRWRITEEALADFERRRSTAPPAPEATRRRKAASSVKQYV